MRKSNKKNVYYLGASSFFNDVGSEMITSILPFYINSLGGGGVATGLLSGLREGISSFLKVFGGYFSDKIGKRKPIVFFGYFISTIFKFSIGLATSWKHLLFFVSLERFGKLRDPPRDAIIAESVSEKGKGFGIHQMFDTAGAVIGTLLVLILFWSFSHDFKTIIFIGATISILSLLPLLFVKEKKFKKNRKNIFYSLGYLDKKLKYTILVTSTFALANFGLYMFFILKAKEITNSFIIPIFLYLLFNLVYAITTAPFGHLSDKIGRKKMLFFAYGLFFFIVIAFSYLYNTFLLAIAFVSYGVIFAITEPTQKAFVSDFTKENKGTALGTYHALKGICMIIGGFIAGILWEINQNLMFSYLAFVSLISIIMLSFTKEKKQN